MIGTRPEAIKLAPLARALAERGLPPTLVFTGQHSGLDPADHRLDGFDRVRLDCPGQSNPHRHVRAVTAALLPHFADAPHLVVVQGDTSSALGGALAAFTAGVPLAHVEAGLRTHDPHQPWPEEEYRTAIDSDADLLFAPTELAAANLRAEQVAGDIFVTGNTGIDAVIETSAGLPAAGLRDSAASRILLTVHRRESWRERLGSIAGAVIELGAGGTPVDVVLHPNRYVARSMRSRLSGAANVSLIPPCGHEELLKLMRDAALVLSDSGGIQEEAPALGVALLVLRDKTERPEAIAAGNARLVGTDRQRIVGEVQRLLSDPVALAAMSRRSFPFGDGQAGPRIAGIIEEWLKKRSVLSPKSMAVPRTA